jgi:putative copper resistance protein D
MLFTKVAGMTDSWFVVIRAVHFTTCLLALGVCVFDRLIVMPTIGRGPSLASNKWDGIARALLLVCLPLALISGALWLVLVAAEMGDVAPLQTVQSGAIAIVWDETHFGRLWKLRLLFWTVSGGAMGLGVLSHRQYARSTVTWVGIAAGACLTGSLAWAGHGQTGPARAMHLSADVIHLLVCALWPGGLLPFLLLLIGLRDMPPAERRPLIAQLTRRFSAMSLISVALLTLTGIINAWLLVGSIASLLKTQYGQVLLIKLACFAGMLALGAMNLLRLKPRLAIVPDGTGELIDGTARRLKWNVFWELILAAAIMAAVGLLGILPPAIHALGHQHHH